MRRVDIVSASAGTGKTYKLAELLHDAIVSHQARPEAIVATTFTNKAAAELRERVRRRLLEAGLVDEARRLGAARIGTVNSICGQLVTDFAFDLGLPPDLRVLDETEAELELRRATSGVLGTGRADGLVNLQDRMVDLDWQKDVEAVIRRARENNIAPPALRACAARGIEAFDELLCDPSDDVTSGAVIGDLRSALEAFLEIFPSLGDGTKVSAGVVEECRAALHRIESAGSLSWHKWQSLTGAEPGAKSRAAFEPVKSAAARHARSAGLRADCHAAIQSVFDLAAEALGAYADHKANMGAIDFVDQEVLALEVLRSPGLTERLEGSIDLVLVDEFQDTSPIQLAIFLALGGLSPRNVWVGDQKQAIFGFRGTDPDLMDAAIESLLEGDEPETLNVSYRSRKELVELTSDVFAAPFAERGIPEERVRIGANDDGSTPDLDPCLEFWQLASKNIGEDVAAVADGVRNLLESDGFRIRDAANPGASRLARAGDVAVLCRTNDRCTALAAALADLGLQASVERAGLFTTPEAIVLRAGLRLWANAADSLAKAELTRILCHPEDPGAWLTSALARLEECPLAPELVDFETVRARNPIAGALDALDLTVEALGIRDLCRSWGDPGERIANVDAVRALAVEYTAIAAREGRAATPWGLNAFLEDVEDGQLDGRPANEGADAVTVSTWHRAKGLEWPVVVLLDTESERTARALGVHVESDRDRIDLADPLGGRLVRYWPNPYQAKQTKSEFHARVASHRAAELAAGVAERENLRVAYVGWTRARDCVVLAARTSKANTGLLARLSVPGRTLAVPPASDDQEYVSLDWGTTPVKARVRRCAPAEARERKVSTGTTYVAAGRKAHPPRWIQPSGDGAAPESGAVIVSIGAPETMGARIELAGSPRMDDLGNAVHGFLAADRVGLDPIERLEMATGLLEGWDVAGVLPAESLLAAGDALRSWIEGRWPGATWHRELPLQHRMQNGSTVRGSCDLALETAGGWVVIDHKSFPGSAADAIERARSHAPQLAAYSAAIAGATGKPVLGRWIHLPVTGLVVEVESNVDR